MQPIQWAPRYVMSGFTPVRCSNISSPLKVQFIRTSDPETNLMQRNDILIFLLKTSPYFSCVHVLLVFVMGVHYFYLFCMEMFSVKNIGNHG